MNLEEQLADLQKTLVEKTRKQKELRNWLLSHFDSPERMKIICDINALDVTIQTINYKINNLLKGEPLLGHDIGDIVQKDNNPKTNKQI